MIAPEEIAHYWNAHAEGLCLLARSRGWSDPEDLVQEAFIRLACQPQQPIDPPAWLARTVRNLAIDACRHRQRQKHREQSFALQRPSWFESEGTRDNRLDGLQATEQLSRLPAEDRDIVVAHLWGGLTFRQIASAFDLPSSTVHRRYLAALARLKAELETIQK